MPISESDLLERLERNDEMLVAEPFGWPISANKVHALAYGLLAGVAIGAAVHFAPAAALTLVVVLGAVSIGLDPETTAGWFERSKRVEFAEYAGSRATLWLLTIEHKPHYFWATAIPAGAATAVIVA